MPNEKTSIPCAVCRDLAPLVADGVASAETAKVSGGSTRQAGSRCQQSTPQTSGKNRKTRTL